MSITTLPPILANDEDMAHERYLVTCEDGVSRHIEPFDWLADARTFAEWGHACTRNHDITVIPKELHTHEH